MLLSRPDSYERLFHDSGVSRFLLGFRAHPLLRARLLEARLERFIGVSIGPKAFEPLFERLLAAPVRCICMAG